MAGRATPMQTRPTTKTNFSECSARQLLDAARTKLNVKSLYALGVALGLSPQYPQRWYRENSIPRTARQLIKLHIGAVD